MQHTGLGLDVGGIMDIPCSSEDIIVSTNRTCASTAREYTLSNFEKDLIELLVGD